MNNHELTQFQLGCERLLIERLAQAGSSISNRTVGFPRLPFPAPFSRWSVPGKRRTYISGSIEGADITFWIHEDWAEFKSSYGSPEFWIAEEFVSAVLEIMQIEKVKGPRKRGWFMRLFEDGCRL